jgi:hypothetical protein
MSADGMVRRYSCPDSDGSWQGAPKARSTPGLRKSILNTNREGAFRNAAIGGREMTLWVIFDQMQPSLSSPL